MVGLVRRLAENPTLQLEGQSKSKYETESVRVASLDLTAPHLT